MNKSRRRKITSVISALENIIEYDLIDSIINEIENILWEEEDAYDNMPENLQYSMRGEASSEAIDSLQDAVDALEEAISIINETNNNNKNKKLKEDDINDLINQAIDSLEEIY